MYICMYVYVNDDNNMETLFFSTSLRWEIFFDRNLATIGREHSKQHLTLDNNENAGKVSEMFILFLKEDWALLIAICCWCCWKWKWYTDCCFREKAIVFWTGSWGYPGEAEKTVSENGREDILAEKNKNNRSKQARKYSIPVNTRHDTISRG